MLLAIFFSGQSIEQLTHTRTHARTHAHTKTGEVTLLKPDKHIFLQSEYSGFSFSSRANQSDTHPEAVSVTALQVYTGYYGHTGTNATSG